MAFLVQTFEEEEEVTLKVLLFLFKIIFSSLLQSNLAAHACFRTPIEGL